MQVSMELTDSQLLAISKDLKAALPDVLQANLDSIVAGLLSVKGGNEERQAFANSLGGSTSWERQQRADKYTTLRDAVVLKTAELTAAQLIADGRLTAQVESMKQWFMENRKDLAAEAFAAWFEKAMAQLAQSCTTQDHRMNMLMASLKTHVNPNLTDGT